ncbi:hypothetical protein LX32DRAFT_264683 [Colletotrichum zoysiae]|uniref:Uncharacterized protein n=1 Tax=Colletotrichum zoysiae TaxID=1216348 RepID=A0AAD9LU38_9PEZI|nr:hypothetical protein LX32DRAFT_264683 [Colletotrichum zoysiae]
MTLLLDKSRNRNRLPTERFGSTDSIRQEGGWALRKRRGAVGASWSIWPRGLSIVNPIHTMYYVVCEEVGSDRFDSGNKTDAFVDDVDHGDSMVSESTWPIRMVGMHAPCRKQEIRQATPTAVVGSRYGYSDADLMPFSLKSWGDGGRSRRPRRGGRKRKGRVAM